MQKVIAELPPKQVINFLLQHFKNTNLQKPGNFQQNGTDFCFKSNEDFWKVLLRERNTAFKSLILEGFRIVDWFPRTPGLYHTEDAFRARMDAKHYLREEKGIKFYNPHGKFHMIEGGVGSVRFKPVTIENQECLLCTATSDNYCHSGIPLAIPDRLVSKIDFDDYKLYFNIIGKVKFLPNFLETHFIHMSRIPQIYVLVDNLEVVSTDRLAEPIKISPMVFFTSNSSTLNTDIENELNQRVTYANCNAHSNEELDIACDWIKFYVSQYSGVIITNFDEQRPAFEAAPFSLQNIMNSNLFTDKNIINIINYVKNINTNGGNYNESILGNYIEALSTGGIEASVDN
ncbi:hypothetical protein LC609_29980 [Nostoc sp. XA013]|nr:hypothetical protein [Nostoc sp. XA013]